MIGAMPAVAVRHERRKGQEKRSKRPSQLYIGGHWLPPNSPSPTPSPSGVPYDDGGGGDGDRLPELYICGKVSIDTFLNNIKMLFILNYKVSALQLIVGSILLGAIVLIVGLVQLVPNAADADHRYIFIGAGTILLVIGLVLTAVRCFCMHCARHRGGMSEVAAERRRTTTTMTPPPALDAAVVASIDVLVQRRDTQVSKHLRYYLTLLKYRFCVNQATNFCRPNQAIILQIKSL